MINKNNEPIKNKKISTSFWVIILSIFFGLAGGLTGAFFIKNHLMSDTLPFLNKEESISQDSLRGANLIIENAKKIVVEQDNKVLETVSSSQNSIVGIFKKKNENNTATSSNSEKTNFSISDYYQITEEVGEGLIVTSDGWVIASELPKNLIDESIIKNYIVITKSKNIYSIDKIVKTNLEPYIFIHLTNAKNLPVKSLVPLESITESQMLVAVNWGGKSYLSSLFEKEKNTGLVKESDIYNKKIVLSDSLDEFFENAFIFSLNGEAVALFNKKTGVIAIDNLLPVIKSLLEKKDIKYPSLGISYVNLSLLTIKDPRYEKGALIYSEGKNPAIKPGSAADLAGLKKGDIILSINSTQINANNDLSQAIKEYSAGEEITVIFLRDGKENMVKIKLQEIKEATSQKI